MAILQALGKFFLAYSVLIFVTGIALSHLNSRGITAAGIVLSAGCTVWVCNDFARKYRRYFSTREKIAMILGIFTIDFLWLAFYGIVSLARSPSAVHLEAILAILAITGIFHFVMIVIMVIMSRNLALKQGFITN